MSDKTPEIVEQAPNNTPSDMQKMKGKPEDMTYPHGHEKTGSHQQHTENLESNTLGAGIPKGGQVKGEGAADGQQYQEHTKGKDFADASKALGPHMGETKPEGNQGSSLNSKTETIPAKGDEKSQEKSEEFKANEEDFPKAGSH